ncbi:hypothetical protein [Paludisphaera rhizosphaerae]|uniref:hypothetical protein n=1 Tax=Paludisphaera rhizosphaerae TaxID=2711216 RepID=UPI0013EC8F72|nr:hypothetical protein [Paludisphaera rhizosphaerae]
MIQSKKALAVVALSALGLAGWKGQDPADPVDAAPSTAGQAAKTAAPPQQFVLITDGRLFEGVVTEDEEENKVVVTMPIGQMKFPVKRVERVFASIQEVHAYKCDQVPEEDIDEQIKLAQWCLAKNLPAEARKHLEQVLSMVPKHTQAKAMHAALVMDEARLARRQQMDADLQRTAGEEVDTGSPAPLSKDVVRGAQRRMGVGDLSMIFDLPPNAANQRFREFRDQVHPVLQTACARCHNERYDGGFQLVDTRRKADQTLDALRVNLDAALSLVDRETPGRSELLASSLRPHSKGMSRPIFQSSTDRGYQILAAWVNSLRLRPTVGAPVAGDPQAAPAAEGGEVFAADRGRITRSTVQVDPITGPGVSAPPPNRQHYETPPMRYQPGQGMVEDKSGGADAPVPFAVSGVMPQTSTPPVAPNAAPASPSNPRLPDAIAKAQAEAEARLSGGAPPLPVDEKGRPAVGKSSKPMKLDPALLQKALQQKNGAE